MIGEKLFSAITSMRYQQAEKITGMMLEMENSELLTLLASPDRLQNTIGRALNILGSANGAARS
eukprot:10567974-Lingulodinium_polyedra.AAC.1